MRNEEFGSRQLAYCSRPSNICDLSDEILYLIVEHVAPGGGTNIGLMRDTWTNSLRVQCLLNYVTQPMAHIDFFKQDFNKIAIQGTPQMAVDKEAICLSRVYSYYPKYNFPLLYV